MSFDLYVLDLDPTPAAADVHTLLEQDGGELTSSLRALVAELEERFPAPTEEADPGPWASWPLAQAAAGGRANAFHLTWDTAETTTETLIEAAARHGLTIFDPQSDLLVPPSAARVGPGADAGQHRSSTRRRWWQRS